MSPVKSAKSASSQPAFDVLSGWPTGSGTMARRNANISLVAGDDHPTPHEPANGNGQKSNINRPYRRLSTSRDLAPAFLLRLTAQP
jgi:hypothetical protein